MHELSIAESIVAIASRHARGRKVEKVELKVGYLRQVVPSALEFAFELVTQGTVAEHATLVLEEVPAAGRCRACGEESVLGEFPFCCASCGGFDLDLFQGEELLVDSLELEEEALTTTEGMTDGR